MISNKQKLLQVFFDNPVPEQGFQLRELSRTIKLAPKSTKNYLKQLEKEKLVLIKKSRVNNYPLYFPNRDNDNFLFLKKLNTIKTIYNSKLLDFIKDNCLPDVIILFGSASRGEDIKESDIDLFVLSQDEDLDLSKFEKILNRKINIFFSESFEKLSDELKSNLINGTILDGYLRIF